MDQSLAIYIGNRMSTPLDYLCSFRGPKPFLVGRPLGPSQAIEKGERYHR